MLFAPFFRLIPSNMKDMFSPMFVCLFVCVLNETNFRQCCLDIYNMVLGLAALSWSSDEYV